MNKDHSIIPLFESHKSIEKKNNSALQTKTEGNTSNIKGNNETTETTEMLNCNKNKRQCNTHKKELLDHMCHFPDLVQDILRKNGGLNLVLWLAKPPAFMAMLNITQQ